MSTHLVAHIDVNWALAADPLQWILQRRHANGWRAVAFVSSHKGILARCMREEGVPPTAANTMLDRLPHTFRAWADSHYGRLSGVSAPGPLPQSTRAKINAHKNLPARAAL